MLFGTVRPLLGTCRYRRLLIRSVAATVILHFSSPPSLTCLGTGPNVAPYPGGASQCAQTSRRFLLYLPKRREQAGREHGGHMCHCSVLRTMQIGVSWGMGTQGPKTALGGGGGELLWVRLYLISWKTSPAGELLQRFLRCEVIFVWLNSSEDLPLTFSLVGFLLKRRWCSVHAARVRYVLICFLYGTV